MTEIWRDIAGYDGLYQVSNLGRVRSFKYKTPRILKPGDDGKGYLFVNLWLDDKPKTCKIHRLVAETFIDNPESKPQVNHINGNKTDNRVENLEWATHDENMRHAAVTGLCKSRQGEDNPYAKLTAAQVTYIRDNPDDLSGTELAKKFNVGKLTISQVQRGITYADAGGRIRDRIDTRIPDETREQIRAEYVPHKRGYGSTALAKKFGVGRQTVLNIIHEN